MPFVKGQKRPEAPIRQKVRELAAMGTTAKDMAFILDRDVASIYSLCRRMGQPLPKRRTLGYHLRVVELYKQGIPRAEIAQRIPLSPDYISRIAGLHGVATMGWRGSNWKAPQVKRMKDLYLQGYSYREIAQIMRQECNRRVTRCMVAGLCYRGRWKRGNGGGTIQS